MNVPTGESRVGWIAFFDWLARVGRAVQRAGATADRPDKGTWPGQPYFDTTLDAPVWRNAANTGWVEGMAGGGGGVTDHGALTGLGDDDHTQYLNQTRGDLRYSQLGHAHSYLTQATADSLYSALAHTHGGLAPTGGSTGQVLTKVSGTNFDMVWQTISSGAAWDFEGGASGASYSIGTLDLEEGGA